MTTTLADTQPIPGSFTIGTILLEPVFLVAASLFWLIVLPLGAVFCALVSLYDRLAEPEPRAVQTAAVLRRSPVNPFALGRTNVPFSESKGSTRRIQRRAEA